MSEEHGRRVSHKTRVIVGLVWIIFIITFGVHAYDLGFGLAESIAFGVIFPPTMVVVSIGLAWVLGTVAVWTNNRLKISDKI